MVREDRTLVFARAAQLHLERLLAIEAEARAARARNIRLQRTRESRHAEHGRTVQQVQLAAHGPTLRTRRPCPRQPQHGGKARTPSTDLQKKTTKVAPTQKLCPPQNKTTTTTKSKSKMSTPKEPPSAGLPEAHGQGEKPRAAAGGAVRRAAGRPAGGQRTGQAHRGEQPRAKGPATARAPGRGARATKRNGNFGMQISLP